MLPLVNKVRLIESTLDNTVCHRTLKEIPVIYALLWAPPRALFDSTTAQGQTKALKWKSLAELFPTMVEEENLNVIFNFDVVEIKRKCFNRLQVQSFEGESMDFDYVFWAGLPSDFEKVAHVNIDKVEMIVKLKV